MSGRKLTLPPYPIMNSLSMASNQVSKVTSIPLEDNVGVQLVWTGSNPQGSITLQISLDQTTWTNLQTTPGTDLVISPGGSAGNAYVDVTQLSAPYIRVAYTTAGGSVGVLNAMITAKQV